MQFLSQLQVQQKNKGVSTGTKWLSSKGAAIDSYSPVDGKLIASVKSADKESYEAVVQQAQAAFAEWRTWPAPKRGNVVRQIGEELRLP
jgi:aldehyde dehydrogenase (NAD+)